MVNKEFFSILELMEKDNIIDKDTFLQALEIGFVSAYKKDFGEGKAIEVKLNPAKHEIRVFAYRKVVDEVEDPEKEISLEDAKLIKPSYKVGSIVSEEVTPKHFSRIATMTAIQVVKQRLNDIKKNRILDEISEREGEIMNAIVRRVESDNVYVELMGSQLEGVMLINDRMKNEVYRPNQIIKVLIKKVKTTPKGVQVLVSRTSPLFVERIFEAEVPELRQGIVVIKNIVREAGDRTKLSVYSDEKDFDPVGALIGTKSARISAVISELNGEKVDIIRWESDPSDYIKGSLSPAKVSLIILNEEEMSALVVIPDDKLSLAIGRTGQNVRLAARLTGWRIDIKSQTAYDEEFKESYSEAVRLREEENREEEGIVEDLFENS